MNMILFRFSGRILERLARATYPASEKMRSDGTDVAGVASKALTAWNKQGKLTFCDFHHVSRGVSFFC